ncbi:nitroreductase [Lysinibacillus alkalisoli]|uniref:Nitroreductase n=1 Tax=Lysinibacillus alkalisoli TaxID=1911548 RepID=A0A917LE18_9BACI|nr:nitroreductase family protein [Lysinibacillus alkalisoli]GGG16002.1 nitroreductase [Lysinibacillus alkalisoli]
MTKDFYEVLAQRRSYYGLDKNIQVSEARIEEIINFAVKHTPSAFNSQSARVAVLFHDKHDELWHITTKALRNVMGDNDFTATQEKMDSFKAAYGTVLFFEDENIVKGLQENFALYADNFPIWSHQASGMHQLVIWSGLEAEGLGASLQHYNPLIDSEVQSAFDIPANWKLVAQMPFGNPIAQPGEKAFEDVANRVKVIR